jgi:hypothetical protein
MTVPGFITPNSISHVGCCTRLLGSAFIHNSKSEADAADLKAISVSQVHMVNAVVIDDGPGGAAEVHQRKSIMAWRSGTGIDVLDLKSTVASGDVVVVDDEIAEGVRYWYLVVHVPVRANG